MTPPQFKSWRGRLGLSINESARTLGISASMVKIYQGGNAPADRTGEIPRTIEWLCWYLENADDVPPEPIEWPKT